MPQWRDFRIVGFHNPSPFRLTGKADLIKHKSVWVHIAAWDNRISGWKHIQKQQQQIQNVSFTVLCNWNDLPLSILTDTIKPLWGRKLIRRQYRKISKDWIWVPLLNWLYIVFLPCLIAVACFFSNFWYAKTCSTYSISIMLMQHFCLYLGKSSNIYIFCSLLF